MWRLPGAMRACPGRTRSPSVASRTRTGQSPLQRSAKACVNRSGMCWTMTSPGASGRIAMRNRWIASVPPVDAPTAITDAADGAPRPVGASGSVRARAAAFTAPSISETTSGIRPTSSREGIRTTPAAPSSRASSVISRPFRVGGDTRTTGVCEARISRSSDGKPRRDRSATSSVSTSGRSRTVTSCASWTPATAPATSISRSAARIAVRMRRVTADPSTTRTRTFRVPPRRGRGPSASWLEELDVSEPWRRLRECLRVRQLHGPEASAAPVPEPSHVDRAGVGVEVELPAELPTEVATDDGNVLASQELVDEPDVPLGDAVAVSTDLEDVAAAEDLRPGAAAIAARLLQRPHETVHRVHAESGVVERVLSTRPRRREHEVVHSAHARDRIEETDGNTRAEERPDDRGLARRVHPADVDCDLRLAAARPLTAHGRSPRGAFL